jgi:nucleotide-binding universal stress UspA family protein
MRFKHVLCLAEFGSEAVMREAGRVARLHKSSLTFLYLHRQPEFVSVLFPRRWHEGGWVDQAMEDLFLQHVFDTTGLEERVFDLIVHRGSAEDALIAHALKLACDLIVVSSQVSMERIVKKAPCAVLVVRRTGGTGVLAATDLSDHTYPTLKAALEAARLSDQPLTGLHSVSLPGLNAPHLGLEVVFPFPESSFAEVTGTARGQLQHAMDHVHAEGEALVELGPPAQAILRAAARLGSGLIVMTSHKKSFLPRLLQGSVTETVARHAPCSVLIMKPVEAGTEAA